MLDPAPTTVLAANLARGTVLGFHEANASKPAYVELGFSNTDYQIYLEPMGDAEALKSRLNKKVIGSIHMSARKITISGAGGQFIDPCSGITRRIQGTIVAVDTDTNRIVVNAGIALHVTPTAPGQHARDFEIGDFVGCDVLSGSGFAIHEG